MNKTILLTIVAIASIAAVSQFMPKSNTRFLGAQDEKTAAWTAWKMKSGKSYGTSTEEAYRFKTFSTNYDYITATNASQKSFWLELNNFADMTKEELTVLRGYKGAAKKSGKVHVATSYPASYDNRDHGLVTGVKNQGQCGSCWAFSTTGGVEGLYAKVNGSQKTFSEQELVDCAGGSWGNLGCSGGLMDSAFRFIEADGITTEAQYAYTAQNGSCRYNKSMEAYIFNGFHDVAHSTNDLKSAIYRQPVSVAVDAQQWSFYGGGVFNNCGQSLDHGVLAVGYTDDYWIVKNSWGASWGEQGYIRLSMGNTCGIQNSASYPTA